MEWNQRVETGGLLLRPLSIDDAPRLAALADNKRIARNLTHAFPNPYDVFGFGYWLAVEAWGNGYATEAAGAFLDHIVATVHPRRFEALVYGWNPTSAGVLEKLGFTLEGRCAQRITRFGEVTDELIYGKVLSL